MIVSFKRLLTALGVVVALGATSTVASAEVFTIDPPDVGVPNLDDPFDADRIAGTYQEVFTVTDETTGEFATEVFFQVTGFTLNGQAVNTTGVTATYGLYVLFSATGNFAPDGVGGFDFFGATGTVSVYLDPELDASCDNGDCLPGSAPGAIDVGGVADILLATAAYVDGPGREGNLAACPPGTDPCPNGNFSLTFGDFELTSPEGEAFFIAPRPFYLTINIEGNFDNFEVEGTQSFTGVADAVFVESVPEPTTLALFGLGLLGSGYAARRRRKA